MALPTGPFHVPPTTSGATIPLPKGTGTRTLSPLELFTFLGEWMVGGWWRKTLYGIVELLILKEIVQVFTNIASAIKGGLMLVVADNAPGLVALTVGWISDEVTKQTPLFETLSERTIEQITGITINSAKIKGFRDAGDIANTQRAIGQEFYQVVSNMLDTGDAARDFSTRMGEEGSFNNLHAYFGTNLDFQLRSLTIATIADVFGYTSLRHLEGLHQSINWAFGFGWLSWSVLSNAMDVTVNAGVKRYFNRQVKPHDLSQAQANKVYIRGHMDPNVWQLIHANAGMRDDARDWQLALEYNQPSVSLIEQMMDRNIIDETKARALLKEHELTSDGTEYEVTKMLKHQEWKLKDDLAREHLLRLKRGWESPADVRPFLTSDDYSPTEVDLALKAHESERIFHLRDAVTREHMKFLRHGWESQEETRRWLEAQHWTEEEIQLAFEANRLEQKAASIPTSKSLTVGEVATFVAIGMWSPLQGQQYLIGLGYEIADVNDLLGYSILQHAISITPKKVRDACETDTHIANLLTAALTSAQVLDPQVIVKNQDFVRLIACYIDSLVPTSGGTGTPPPPNLPPAPTALVATPGSKKVDLSWQPVPLLGDYLVYRREVGAAIFLAISQPSTATSYTDTSVSSNETYVYAVRFRTQGVESANSNEVTVTPTA